MTTAIACLLLVLAAESADAQPAAGRELALWRLHHPRYAGKCLPFEDGYVCVPGYDNRHPSSAGLTLAEAGRRLSVRYEQTVSGLSRSFTRRPDEAEIAAYAALLPGLEVGHYGHVASVRVAEVLGEQEMIVRGIELIDGDALKEAVDAEARLVAGVDRTTAEAYMQWKFGHRLAAAERQRDRTYRQPVRLVGFPTRGLDRRDRYAGPDGEGLDLALVKLERFGKRDEPRLVAIPLEQVRTTIGLDEAAFAELLAERGLDRTGFIELVQQMHRDHRDRAKAEQQVFLRLLAIDAPAPDEEDSKTQD